MAIVTGNRNALPGLPRYDSTTYMHRVKRDSVSVTLLDILLHDERSCAIDRRNTSTVTKRIVHHGMASIAQQLPLFHRRSLSLPRFVIHDESPRRS